MLAPRRCNGCGKQWNGQIAARGQGRCSKSPLAASTPVVSAPVALAHSQIARFAKPL